MKENFAACVILYHPKKEDIDNLYTYCNKVKKLYIYDNTEGNSNEELFVEITNATYYWDGENKGLSDRLNAACQKAIEDKFEYLLTMDQDSSFLEENIDCYFENILNFPNKNSAALFNLEYEKEFQPVKKNQISIKKKDHLITSASVMNLNLYHIIGGFDENLFIDGVDIDYCYSAKAKGFDNIQFTNNYFKHSLGEPVKRGTIYTLFLFKKNKTIHSPLRIYYMYRNMLYLENKYKNSLPEVINELVKNYKHHIKKSIKYSENIFEANRFKKRAIIDFKNGRMGKIQL